MNKNTLLEQIGIDSYYTLEDMEDLAHEILHTLPSDPSPIIKNFYGRVFEKKALRILQTLSEALQKIKDTDIRLYYTDKQEVYDYISDLHDIWTWIYKLITQQA